MAPSGSDELRTALVPVVSGELSNALKRTGKFSIVLPYKFDPLLRRGLAESAISDDDLSGFVLTPSLSSAQTVLSKLSLDQPGMVAQVRLESLQVGGTPQSPSVQVRMHGDLYEVQPPGGRPVAGQRALVSQHHRDQPTLYGPARLKTACARRRRRRSTTSRRPLSRRPPSSICPSRLARPR